MPQRTVLQVGFGNFGPTHLAAWRALGLAERLIVADPSEAARRACRGLGLAQAQVIADYDEAIDGADLVDVVSATDTHFEICARALRAGLPVFIEKPMTSNLAEAERLAGIVAETGCPLQVGFYFRHHPLAQAMRERIRAGGLGQLRYLSSRFTGFKRGRTDSGVLLNDAIHFIDLHNWLMDGFPVRVQATLLDHFGRGLEDMALLEMHYPGGVVARIEAGCTIPGRWNDNIVKGATASKETTAAGSEGAIEADFVTQTMLCHQVRHELQAGVWRPVFGEISRPHIATAEPVDVVTSELETFVGHVERSETPKYRKIADIFVRPSRSEGLGNSFFSAMASRLPVVATQEGGIADFLFDAKRNPDKETTGWAVDKNSPQQIAEAVKDILAHPEQVKKVTDTAYRLAFEKYNWDTIARDMREKVFDCTLK